MLRTAHEDDSDARATMTGLALTAIVRRGGRSRRGGRRRRSPRYRDGFRESLFYQAGVAANLGQQPTNPRCRAAGTGGINAGKLGASDIRPGDSVGTGRPYRARVGASGYLRARRNWISDERRFVLIGDSPQMEEFDRWYASSVLARRSYLDALAVFTGLWNYAREIDADFPGDWEADIEVDVLLARVLNAATQP